MKTPVIPLSTLLLVGLAGLAITATVVEGRSYDRKASQDLIHQLFTKIASLQYSEDVPYVKLKSFLAQKGIYHSDIKLYFHGKLELALMRRLMSIPDNNMFVTAWVTSSLLEALRYGQSPQPSPSQLEAALDAIYAHRDMNKAYNTSTYAFWQQRYNQTLKYWDSTPVNLLGAFSMLDDVPVDELQKLLDALGLKDIGDILKSILNMQAGYIDAFHIPPDFDDTFVNLGLGSLLSDMRSDFPDAWAKWEANNGNISSVFAALEKYAYRPFSKDNNTNFIDPRTYFYLRGFLDKVYDSGNTNLALVSTWIQNLDELRVEHGKGVTMPFQCNNVDVTVAANTLFGVTSSILSGLVKPEVLDGETGRIYLNTSTMIAFEITTNLSNRADLALLYYPSKIEFDWFVARTVDLMETHLITQPLPHPIMKTVYGTLKQALEGPMTQFILSKAKTDLTLAVHFDDFLGDGDLTIDNRTFERAEDRIFTTAMAANALMYTWTRYDRKSKSCQWKQGVPEQVRRTVTGTILWLTEHTLDGNYDPWNAFFSGSVKGYETLPLWYPGNMFEYLNGTEVKDPSQRYTEASIYAVRGYIPEPVYAKMIQEKHFGHTTPLQFKGFNSVNGYFPLWSSEPYTYSTTLLALSRFNNIIA